MPLQQWHAKVTLTGVLDRYTLRLRLPGLDDLPDPGGQRPGTGEAAVTSTRYRAPLTGTDRLVLAARFEAYLTWRHAGHPAPRSARETAEPTRIGAMRTSCAHRRQLTLPMLSSSPNVPIGNRPLIAQIALYGRSSRRLNPTSERAYGGYRVPQTPRAVTVAHGSFTGLSFRLVTATARCAAAPQLCRVRVSRWAGR